MSLLGELTSGCGRLANTTYRLDSNSSMIPSPLESTL